MKMIKKAPSWSSFGFQYVGTVGRCNVLLCLLARWLASFDFVGSRPPLRSVYTLCAHCDFFSFQQHCSILFPTSAYFFITPVIRRLENNKKENDQNGIRGAIL